IPFGGEFVAIRDHFWNLERRVDVDERKRHVAEKRLPRQPQENRAVLPYRPEHAEILESCIGFSKNVHAPVFQLIQMRHVAADVCRARTPVRSPITKPAMRSDGWLYRSGDDRSPATPEFRKMQSPAATSHSIVGPNRGYRSASPSATRQNFNELPSLIRSTGPSLAMNASSSELPCDRLSTTRVGPHRPAPPTIRTD